MVRKLATVARVDCVRAHPNADRLDIVTIRGWEVVTQKALYQEGDLCVYCEIDSLLPKDNAEFASFSSCKWKIKTKKIRGILSQGVCFPLTILPAGAWEEDEDVTTLLGITLMDAEIPSHYLQNTRPEDMIDFPCGIPRTEEQRIQNLSKDEIEDLANGTRPLYVTEKLDGTSCTYYLDEDGKFHVCSRNKELLDITKSRYWEFANEHYIQQDLEMLGIPVAVQGELCGPKINKNNYGLDRTRFYVFSVYFPTDSRYATYAEVQDICNTLSLDIVPHFAYIEKGKGMTRKEALEMADGPSILNPKSMREGLVFRSVWGDRNRVSFKAISNVYLQIK